MVGPLDPRMKAMVVVHRAGLVSILAGLLAMSNPVSAGQPEDMLRALNAYMDEEPIENFLLQPDVLPDDPRDEFFTVVDVRTHEEVAQGHIPGAIHIPYYRLGELLELLADDRDAPVLLYCSRTGMRSTHAMMALRMLGFHNTWYLVGGIDRWAEEGRPVAQGVP
jgi:rhodanese-related sulfurtransferase